MPRMRISRWARLRFTPSSTAILRLPKNGQLHVQLVELAHQAQVLRALRLRLVVVGRARHSQQFALLLNAEARMGGIDPWALVFSR